MSTHHWQRKFLPLKANKPQEQGFILALVVTNSVGTLTQSGKSFSKSRERDAISALIAKDLEGLRATAFNYIRCDPSPQPNEPAGCPTARDNSFADGQITFVPDVTRLQGRHPGRRPGVHRRCLGGHLHPGHPLNSLGSEPPGGEHLAHGERDGQRARGEIQLAFLGIRQ